MTLADAYSSASEVRLACGVTIAVSRLGGLGKYFSSAGQSHTFSMDVPSLSFAS